MVPVVDGRELDRNYMYIICGVFDPSGVVKNWGGHCLLAISKASIINSADIYPNIMESVLVEPQTGEYTANMTNTNLIKVFDSGMPPTTLHYVSMIITDDDLKIFYPYGDKVEWIGYYDFLNNSNKIKGIMKK